MQPLLAACVMVAQARHFLGCPGRLPGWARREPQAAKGWSRQRKQLPSESLT